MNAQEQELDRGRAPVSQRVRILMLTQYPFAAEDERLGGIMQASFRLVRALASLDDERIDVHVITESSAVDTPTTRSLAANATVTYFPRARSKLGAFLFGYPNATRVLADAVESIDPHIIHAQGAAKYIFAATHSRVPHVITVHGIYKNEMKVAKSRPGIAGWFQRHGKTLLEEIYAGRIRNLIAITEEIAQFVKKRSPAASVYRIDNPIDPDFFNIPPLGPNPAPGILFVAAITYRKGLDFLLEAFEDVQRRVPSARLQIAGIWHWDPEYVSGLQKRYAARISEGQVTFLGGISQERLLAEMATASVLCVPSRSESAPMVISQAMAAGRPVVASRVGGIPSMIEDGRTGRLWTVGDIAALSDLLVEVLSNAEIARRMGGAARAVALERYSDTAVAEKTVEAYLRVASNGR